jgi:hypothetical protein
LQGFPDYFHVPKGPATLEVLLHDSQEMRPVAEWRACVRLLADSCEQWLQANPDSRLLRLEVSPNLLGIQGVVPGGQGVDPMPYPIALVRPLMGGTWLEGAASALEGLRRRVEEAQHATLDGLALVRYCSKRDKGALPYCPWGEAQATDLPYSELVLMREDHDMTTGFEIVRGDEVGCWLQLLLDLKEYPLADIQVDEVGAWLCGRARYAWEIVTLRPHEVVPGLSHANLPTDESKHLLRRFQAAMRDSNLQSLGERGRRRLGGIDEPPTHCRLDAHRVLRALAERGESWEGFCASIGVTAQLPTKPVELGVFLTLAEHLEHADPASLLLRPTRSELSAVTDDQLLRALMPRVNHVRYRVVTGVSQDKRVVIQEAVAEFATSIAMRNGALPFKSDLPDLVYSGDGEELRQALEDIGLVMFVGLMPHLTPIPEDIRVKFPQLGRYAFGASLFVDIDVAA